MSKLNYGTIIYNNKDIQWTTMNLLIFRNSRLHVYCNILEKRYLNRN